MAGLEEGCEVLDIRLFVLLLRSPRLNGVMERPDFYIVPSKFVADFVRNDHQGWLDRPGKKGQPHKDNPVRNFRDPKGEFRERWDLLGL